MHVRSQTQESSSSAQTPLLDPALAEQHLKKLGLPIDDEIKLGLDYSPRAVFGGVVAAIWLFLIQRTGRAFLTFDQLLACIESMQKYGGTFRYMIDGLPGLRGPNIELGHKIVVRSVPATGELIAYVEILGVLKVGGLFAAGTPGCALEHIYAYDLTQKADRSGEFSVDPAVFDAQNWRAVGLGPVDADALREHFRKALNELAQFYYQRSAAKPEP